MKKKTKRNLIIGGSIAGILLGVLGWRMYRSRDYSIRMDLGNGKNPKLEVPSGEKLSYTYTVKEFNINGEHQKNVNFVAVESIAKPGLDSLIKPKRVDSINVPDGKNPNIINPSNKFTVSKGETINLRYSAEQSLAERLKTGAKYVICDIEVKGI